MEENTNEIKDKKALNKIDRYFKISARNSSVSTEIFAGVTTFLAMCYLLVVVPAQMLLVGTDHILWPSLFIATAIASVIGCMLSAFLSNMPLAQSSGLSVTAIVGGIFGYGAGLYSYHFADGRDMAFSFGNAMLIAFISAILFFLLTVIPCGRDKNTGKLIGIREKIFEVIPESIRIAIPVGIGLFIAFIGMQKAGLIVNNDYTLVGLVSFNSWGISGGYQAKGAIICLISLFSIAILSHYKVKGAVMLGILISTVVAIPMGVADLDILAGKSVTWKFWKNFENFFSMDEGKGGSFLAAFTSGFDFPKGTAFTVIVLVVSFCMLDIFDTMGAVLGCCTKANLLDEYGKPVNFSRTMLSDSIATCAGTFLGTPTVSALVESGTGIAAGGKTGLTALTAGGLFLLSIFLLPLFAFIPAAASAGALIYVGVLMMGSVVKIDFSDIRVALPAFVTIIMMPLTYSITSGIGLGIISFVVINSLCYLIEIIKFAVVSKKGGEASKPKWNISVVMLVITAFFIVYFFVPTAI